MYATLAEFTEAGLLAAFGTSEPVRYETKTERHAHFRCRLCLRIFDVDAPPPDAAPFERVGHQVDELEIRAEGICEECQDFRAGLIAGTEAITATGASEGLVADTLAVDELETPIGTLLLAATPQGLARVAFPEHGDVAFLRARVGASAPAAARAHLDDARDQLVRYFAGESAPFSCTIDWHQVGRRADLASLSAVSYGDQRSYHLLETGDLPTGLGEAFGANPIAIVAPCHRVTLGAALPDHFVGGVPRRLWLLDHEQHGRAT